MANKYTDEEIQELAASYAMGILGSEDKALFEIILTWDNRASFYLEYFNEIMEELSYDSAPLEEPQGLEERLFKYMQMNK